MQSVKVRLSLTVSAESDSAALAMIERAFGRGLAAIGSYAIAAGTVRKSVRSSVRVVAPRTVKPRAVKAQAATAATSTGKGKARKPRAPMSDERKAQVIASLAKARAARKSFTVLSSPVVTQ